MSKKILPCLLIAAILVVNAALLPTICGYEKTMTMEFSLNGVVPGVQQNQLEYVADKLAGYLYTETYVFGWMKEYTAKQTFTGDVSWITLLSTFLLDKEKYSTLKQYQDTGTITQGDSIFGAHYDKSLKNDRKTSDYYSKISWTITYNKNKKKFTISVIDTEHPENRYTRDVSA